LLISTTEKFNKRISMTPREKTPQSTGSRFAALKNLTEAGSSPEQTLKRLAELLGPAKMKGVFQLRLLKEGKMAGSSVSTMAIGPGKSKRSAKPAKPTVEVITTPEIWQEVSSGRLAPHDAFLGGQMRVRGDVRIAQRIVKHLAGSAGLTSVCSEEEQ
jgi:putative sterol carrier protein